MNHIRQLAECRTDQLAESLRCSGYFCGLRFGNVPYKVAKLGNHSKHLLTMLQKQDLRPLSDDVFHLI